MKKKLSRIICVLCACCAVFVFTASAQTAYVVKNDSGTYNSAAVGLAASATFVADAYNTSPGNVTARCQKAIPGAAFTNITAGTVTPSNTFQYTSKPGAQASYRLQLSGPGTADGYVTC